MSTRRQIFTVTEVNRKARLALEHSLGEVWVEGELSRITVHSSGHWYFTLKDAGAAVSCAMFARDNQFVLFHPKEGLKVQMLARPSLYEPSGRYQLIATKLEETGQGNLQEQFEKLKAKLAAEGLFDAERKQKLPLLPQRIGVVTSPTGAAIRDIITVLKRRYPNLQILLAPVTVQGPSAAKSIAAAIRYLDTKADSIDLIIAGRGGGSIEDLWAFNEEVVARAIAEAKTPIISAVGHEIDFTIADFVADLRAPTPSAAAELAVREKTQLKSDLIKTQKELSQSLQRQLRELRHRLNAAQKSYLFREPAALVTRHRQTLQNHETRLADLLKLAIQQRAQRLESAQLRLPFLLKSELQRAHQKIDDLEMRAQNQIIRSTERKRDKIERLRSQLRMLNPQAVIGRGYSLTTNKNGQVVRKLEHINQGDELITQLADGKVISKVTEKR